MNPAWPPICAALGALPRVAGAIFVVSLAAGCALAPPHPERFSFAVIGDQPYNAFEEAAFDRFIDAMNAEPLAFVAHVGDIKSGDSACTDVLYTERRARLARSRHPVHFTPGDNDWADCPRSGAEPLERLARLREIFFDVPPGTPAAGCASLPENRTWEHPLPLLGQRVVFVSLHVIGGGDNRGLGASTDGEADCRREANLAWLARAFAGDRERLAAVVVFFHANPFLASRPGAFDALRAAIARHALTLGKPVLVVHGDTHWHRIDKPFLGNNSLPIENLTRMEVFGSPFLGWVRVTVDPNDAQFFRFETR